MENGLTAATTLARVAAVPQLQCRPVLVNICGFYHKSLKEGQPVREAFNTVSKYWKSGQVWDGTVEEEADSEEDEINELVVYND